MPNPTSSYLHTLAKDEAIAFVGSLQTVKDHLSSELEWMKSRVQQKTAQLQGIDALLSEAANLGLIKGQAAASTETTAPPVEDTPPLVEVGLLAASAAAPSAESAAATNGTAPVADASLAALNLAALAANGDSPSSPSSTEATSAPEAAPAKSAKSGKAGKTQKKPGRPPKAKRDASPVSRTSTKKPKASTQAPKGGKRSEMADFRRYLQAEFQDKSLTDAVGEILNTAKEPLSADNVMAELYEGLSGDEYKRAKNSIANVLTVGRSKGKWRSTGRGLYAGTGV